METALCERKICVGRVELGIGQHLSRPLIQRWHYRAWTRIFSRKAMFLVFIVKYYKFAGCYKKFSFNPLTWRNIKNCGTRMSQLILKCPGTKFVRGGQRVT